jgi:hypothetical protein
MMFGALLDVSSDWTMLVSLALHTRHAPEAKGVRVSPSLVTGG